MPRYAITVQLASPGASGAADNLGVPIHGHLVEFDGDPSSKADYMRLLHLAAAQAGAIIVGHEDDGTPVRVRDLAA